jgi:hypothetical protein
MYLAEVNMRLLHGRTQSRIGKSVLSRASADPEADLAGTIRQNRAGLVILGAQLVEAGKFCCKLVHGLKRKVQASG